MSPRMVNTCRKQPAVPPEVTCTKLCTPKVTSAQLGTPEVAAHSEVTEAKGHHNNTQSQYSKIYFFWGRNSQRKNGNILDNCYGPSEKRIYKEVGGTKIIL